MNIVRHELRKIILSPALAGFVLVCLLFNIALVFSSRCEFSNYIAQVSHTTGYVLGPEFDQRVADLERGEHSAFLRLHTEGFVDVFDGYTTGYIAEAYIAMHELTGMAARLMRAKYARLQGSVDALYESGAGMTLYFAGVTYNRHTQLFRVVMSALLVQGILLGAMIMLLSLGHEYNAKTEGVVYATKTGRRIVTAKLIAGLAAALVAYALLAIVTLMVHFGLNPMGGTWGSSVSSGFNYIWEIFGTRPFVTWWEFTIRGYLAASIGVSVGLGICFGLMAYIVGLWVRNSYIGFLIIVAANAGIVAYTFHFNVWMLNYQLTLTPMWLVLQQGMWFTDGGSNVVWPYFETIGLGASLALLALTGVLSTVRFKRRNLL